MASVAQTPDTLNPMNRGGKWILNQAPTSPPVETRLAWELDIEGSTVAQGSELTTSGSDNVIVDPRSDMVGFMKMQIPGLTPQSVYNITSYIIAEATLAYGTIEIDFSTEPPSKTVNVGSSSGPFDFINAMIRPHHGDILGDTTSQYLSDMPEVVYTHPWAFSWICVYGTSGINGFYRTCGGDTDTFTMSAPFTASAVPCGPANLGLPEDVEYYTLEFVGAGLAKTFRFHVEQGARQEECGSIAFLEPIGGLSGHGFTQISQGGGIASQKIELHSEPDSTFSDWANMGQTIVSRVGTPAFSMSCRVRPSRQYYNFVDGMLGSPIAWIHRVDRSGADVFIKAEITGATLSPAAIDGYGTLSVSATLLHEVKGQRSVW